MRWPHALHNWPLSTWSRRVECTSHQWHVQEYGQGPLLLFLHGAGASTHSWAPVMEEMAKDHHIIAVDLPGHGFTQLGSKMRSGLDAMTEDLGALCAQEGWQPTKIIAHSAGAAIALNLCDHFWQGTKPLPEVVAVNPALDDFEGPAGVLFPLIAKTLVLNPFVPWLFSKSPFTHSRAERLISGTGSTIPESQLACYAQLLADTDHVQGALMMMAQWSLRDLKSRLPHIENHCTVMIGDKDRAIPPHRVRSVIAMLPNVTSIEKTGLGHLLHEEDPETIVQVLRN